MIWPPWLWEMILKSSNDRHYSFQLLLTNGKTIRLLGSDGILCCSEYDVMWNCIALVWFRPVLWLLWYSFFGVGYEIVLHWHCLTWRGVILCLCLCLWLCLCTVHCIAVLVVLLVGVANFLPVQSVGGWHWPQLLHYSALQSADLYTQCITHVPQQHNVIISGKGLLL